VCDRLQNRDLIAAERESELSGAAHVDEPGTGAAVLVEQFETDGHVALVGVPVGREGRSNAAVVINDLEPSGSQDTGVCLWCHGRTPM